MQCSVGIYREYDVSHKNEWFQGKPFPKASRIRYKPEGLR